MDQAAATNSVQSLIGAEFEAEDQMFGERPGYYRKTGLEYSPIVAVSTLPVVPEETHQGLADSRTPSAPISKRVVTYQIRECLENFQQGE